MRKKIHIAIDGPVAAGKGTTALLLAKKLKIVYVDTGAMYRAVALLGLRNKVDLKDEKKLLELLKINKIHFKISKKPGRGCGIFLKEENILEKIRTQEVSWGSSVVGTLPKIRKYLVARQQQLAEKESVVMEGRDIAAKVLPRAELKVYLTADQKIRAKRRQRQLLERGIKQSFNKVLTETKTRDYQDARRKADPLKIVPDAFVLDTTKMTIDQVAETIIKKLQEKLKNSK